MRKIKTSDITDTNGMPVKAGVLDHLQLSISDPIAELGAAMIGPGYDPTKVYILRGCVNSGTHPAYNITAGSVFFNGEVYSVPAASFTLGGSNVAVGSIVISQYSDGAKADPIEFTDGVQRNVLEIRQIVIAGALSGAGAANFLDFRIANPVIGSGAVIWYYPSTNNLVDFNTITGLGISAKTRGLAICDGQNGRPNIKGKVIVGVDPTGAIAYAASMPGAAGAATVTIAKTNLPDITLDIPFTGSTTDSPGDNNVAFGSDTDVPGKHLTTETLGDGTPLSIMQPFMIAIPCIRLY